MKEFLVSLKCSIRKFPCLLSSIKHNRCTHNISLHKHLRITDTSVNVALRSKMNNSVYVILCKNLLNCFPIAYISLDKCVVIPVFYIFKILQITCICQNIHINYTNLIVVLSKHIVNII